MADPPVMENSAYFTSFIFRRTRSRGFTLVEMLVIIAVLGILVAIAIPTFGVISESAKAKGAAQTLATDLQLAKMRAISQSKRCRILFLSGTSYKFQYYDAAGSVWRDMTGEVVRTFDSCSNPYFHEGVTLTAPAGNEIVFQPWGSSTSTSIQVQNAHKRWTITIANSGKISTEVIDL